MAPSKLPSKAGLSKDPHEILVGIDFGTTYSGIAWAQTAKPDRQTAIIQWPNAEGSLEGQTSEKVPTLICYENNKCLWGFGIPDGKARHQWFKLNLDPSQKHEEISLLAVNYPDPKALPPGYNNRPNAVKLTTDYLAQLQQHTMKILRLKLGDGVVNTTPLRYTITVPAIWTDAAKAKTGRCAFAAGMGHDVNIVSEPEAAVVYALDAIDPHHLKVGDNFVLCDAGGGTVDLITYAIVSLDPVVKVREAVPGSGSACGSTFLNRIFEKWLEGYLCDLDGYGEDTLQDAMKQFEDITKRTFSGDDQIVIIGVPGLTDNPEKCVKRGKLTIKADRLKELFQPVMTAITTLVKSQLQQSKTAKSVILVGGFGQSPYLRKCIRQVIGDKIEIMQPAYGWTAVVRGALLKALHDNSPASSKFAIASRQARRAYGMHKMDKFDANKHLSLNRYWSAYNGYFGVTVMRWFVKRGDEVDQTNPLITQWYQTQKVSKGYFEDRENDLYVYTPRDEEDAPDFPDKGEQKLVTLTAKLSTIPITQVPIVTGSDGDKYYRIDYQIKVAFFSAHMEFSLWYNGVCYGKVEAEFL